MRAGRIAALAIALIVALDATQRRAQQAARGNAFRRDPPPTDWDFVFALESK